MIIAIDGTTASGKGTIAKRLSGWYGLPHMDTGRLYRAVGVAALKQGVALDAAGPLADIARSLDLNDFIEHELRSAEAGKAASVVAAIPSVRQALFELQRAFATRAGGALLDGRDIGTVIAPDADVKLWIDASVEERARRRFLELSKMGEEVTQHGVLRQLQERDARDSQRKDAPMKPADDAIWIDTTRMTPDECLARAIEIVEARKARR